MHHVNLGFKSKYKSCKFCFYYVFENLKSLEVDSFIEKLTVKFVWANLPLKYGAIFKIASEKHYANLRRFTEMI